MGETRVRFAPSPTGHLHIGGARTALYNWLYAKQKKGKFILRIEDTDIQRSTEESIQTILDGLKWFGLDWDEGPGKEGSYGPYFQSQRLDIYNQQLNRLLEEEKAYRCFCTNEKLSIKKEEAKKNKTQYKYDNTCRNLSGEQIEKNLKNNNPFVIRLKQDRNDDIIFNDMIKEEIKISSSMLDDFIIRKSDGYPVYNFAVVCDDALMKIDTVIRGDDHISNTPRQILLYKALGFEVPAFAHLPMILGEDKTRLSKRHGATAILQYRELGFLPEALRNYLARLGWGYDDSQEIFTTEELIEKFSIEKVSKNPAIFNYKKLQWLNGNYIQKLNIDERTEAVLPYLKNKGYIDNEFIQKNKDYLKKIVEIIGDRIKTFPDVLYYSDFFFKDEIKFEEDVINKLFSKVDLTDTYNKIINSLNSIKNWTKDEIISQLEKASTDTSIKRKDYYQAIRAGLTGKLNSPDLMDIMLIMGKEKVLQRLKVAGGRCVTL